VRGSVEMHDPKTRRLGIIAQLCPAISSQLRHVSTIEKKCQAAISPPRVPTMWWTWPTSRWDLLASLGHPCTFQRVSRLGGISARHSSSGHEPSFAALSTGRHLYSTGRPSRWALAHIIVYSVKVYVPLDRKWSFRRRSYQPISWRSTEETKSNRTKANTTRTK